jgi:hypothetical protein
MRASFAAAAYLALVLGGLTGCTPSLFQYNGALGSEYDSQACVEDALLRGSPDAELARAAAREFAQACEAGDGASCSAMGVMTENGRGVARDERRAARYYDRACSSGNARGCVHLASLELSGKVGGVAAEVAKRRLETACREGEPAGCEELGRRLAVGDGLPPDVRRARSLLERSCTDGRSRACYELAMIDTPPGTSPNLWAIELFVDACVRGYEPACERLGKQAQPAADARGLVARVP